MNLLEAIRIILDCHTDEGGANKEYLLVLDNVGKIVVDKVYILGNEDGKKYEKARYLQAWRMLHDSFKEQK